MKKCDDTNHEYQLITEDVTRKKNKEGKTEIFKTLFCTKCGDTKSILVAVWDAKPKVEEKPF